MVQVGDADGGGQNRALQSYAEGLRAQVGQDEGTVCLHEWACGSGGRDGLGGLRRPSGPMDLRRWEVGMGGAESGTLRDTRKGVWARTG